MARVGFDGLMISPNGKGHARSERHAAEALARRGEHEVVVFVREDVRVDGAETVRIADRLTIDWELRGVVQASRKHRLDCYVSLSERLPLRGGPPFVVWLFESPLHRIRQNRAAGAPLRHRGSDVATQVLWKRSLRRAAHVAMGSAATEREVLAAIPKLAGRTSVVYPALAPGFSPGPSTRAGRQYVFHLGSRDPRDNTRTAEEACRLAGAELLVAGDGGDLGRVSDQELVDLYRGAAAFVDPSLYEGFGYGVLEAMACGAPVIASDVTSLPEVVGDAGLLCDARSPQSFADAIRRVLHEDGLAEDLRARGLERARHFSWDSAAAGLAQAIAEALA
jgi:glycosyltransferase involved in cell wall biosynthesis